MRPSDEELDKEFTTCDRRQKIERSPHPKKIHTAIFGQMTENM